MIGAYSTLFGTAFLAATVFPAQSELLLAYLLSTGNYDWTPLLIVATCGNVLGSCVNWVLGRAIERFKGRAWFPVSGASLLRAEHWYGRWGKWSLLLSWAPIVGDALTIVAGMLRLNLGTFVSITLVAKSARYAVVALAVAGAVR